MSILLTRQICTAGASEEVVGKGIKGYRDNIVLATKGRQKMGDGPNQQGASRYHLMQELDNSLRRLDVEHIDVYYTHTRTLRFLSKRRCVRWMIWYVAEGPIYRVLEFQSLASM